MKPSPWEYQWTKVCDQLHVYFRHRIEPTIDNFGKPYSQVLAYLIQEEGSWDWRAYKHVGEQVEVLDGISSYSLAVLVKPQVENLIDQEISKNLNN
ncbi:hypothetical protein Dfri01_39420 [Dyadobacter frigoris]|uniref:hypothetical protein n=1 Tax=Dyadobacter frigoris TaxID=2576211 RepID=UPI0024A2FAC7|nr:hypothetical protein [Dyadobacter frigoris]GLU54481.1 hypothetical protein Dfri01_39420 [Dyadobacter frigoris]